MLDDDFRAEVRAEAAELIARHELTMHRINERKDAEYRRTSAREGMARIWRMRRSAEPVADSIRYAGMPAAVIRGYQEARRKREAAAND